MVVNKVDSAREIDDLMPLINKLYDGTVLGKHISKAGYLAWLVSTLANPDFVIWYAIDGVEVKGFCILQKTLRLFEFECHVCDVIMDWVDQEFSNEFMDRIEAWAQDKQCTTISCYTNRPNGMAKRFGFEEAGTLLIKAI